MDEFEMNRECFEALGLEYPEEGEEEQEPADPVPGEEPIEEDPAAEAEEIEEGGEEPEGENEQEPADPAQEEGNTGQSKAERARQAKLRREREQQTAIDAALKAEREKHAREMKLVFQHAGFTDGEEPVETMEQFEAYQRKMGDARLEREMKSGKMTPQGMELLMERTAERVMGAKAQAPAPETKPETEPGDPVAKAAFQRQVEAELAEIRKFDPGIKSVADFSRLDRAEAFFREVRDHGHSFEEAYKFVYADKIAEAKARRAAAAAAQRTRDGVRGKAHMGPVGAKGGGDVSVTQAEVDAFRLVHPGATMEEIRKAYKNLE